MKLKKKIRFDTIKRMRIKYDKINKLHSLNFFQGQHVFQSWDEKKEIGGNVALL